MFLDLEFLPLNIHVQIINQITDFTMILKQKYEFHSFVLHIHILIFTPCNFNVYISQTK